jgi:dynactin complex subunit
MIGIISYVGVELDGEFKGKNNGSAKGKSYFKCRTGQGIFWRTERVQHWPDSKKSDKKTKLDPEVKLKSPQAPIFSDENGISTKLEKSPEDQKEANSTPLATTDELQLKEQLNEPKNTASSPLQKPIEEKREPLSTPRSCLTQQKRGRMASPVPSFIHSSFPKSSHHIRKSTEPLLVNITGLVHTDSQSDSGAQIEIKRQRARSLSTKPEDIDFDENIVALTRAFEKIKREKKKDNNSKKDHIESQGDNSALISEIQELRKSLESVKLEKIIAEEAKVAAEKAKNTIEKQ